MSIRMLSFELLTQQPVEHSQSFRSAFWKLAQGIHRQRRKPRRKVRINGPTPIGPSGSTKELGALDRHRMRPLPAPCQAHHDEAGERDGLQKPAAGRLNIRQDRQRPPSRQIPCHAKHRVARWPMIMARLADCDQRRQRIADHRQPQRREPLVRARGQLKRQREHPTPSPPALPKPAGQGAHGQDRR